MKPLVNLGGTFLRVLKPLDLAPKWTISQTSFDADLNNLIQFSGVNVEDLCQALSLNLKYSVDDVY